MPGQHHGAEPARAEVLQLRVSGSIPLRHVDRPLWGRSLILTVTEESFPAVIHARPHRARGFPRARRRLPVRSAADVTHDVLDTGVVLEAVHGQVLAVPGMLEAAVRHLGHYRDV